MSKVHSVGVLRYGFPGLAIGLALAWWGGQGPTARLMGAPPAAVADPGANGILAFSSAVGNSSQLLYMIDTRAKAFSIYRVDPGNTQGAGTVKLVAARQCRWDLQMSEYNNQQPGAADIEAMLKSMPK